MDLESKVADLALQLSTLKGYWDNGLGAIQRINQEISELKRSLASVESKFSNHQYDLKDALNEFAKLKSLVATIREEFSRNLTTEAHSLLRNIENKHESISYIVSEHNAKITRFESVLDEIAIDAKNASLKANNAEMMTMLNKKKVEQACLLVQNQQLQK